MIQQNGESFRRHFDITPEFRVGIHIGDVTVGEIGTHQKRSCHERRYDEYHSQDKERLQRTQSKIHCIKRCN